MSTANETTVEDVVASDELFEGPTGGEVRFAGHEDDEALREVDLLSIVVNPPKRKERAYSADQVDALFRAAQDHMDTQTERLRELLSAKSANDAAVAAITVQYGDEIDGLREQISVLTERLGQTTAGNSSLRETIGETTIQLVEIAEARDTAVRERDEALTALDEAVRARNEALNARDEAERKPAVVTEVSQASELLTRAAALADEHVASAKRNAEGIVAQAHLDVATVNQQASEVKRLTTSEVNEMVAFLEASLASAQTMARRIAG